MLLAGCLFAAEDPELAALAELSDLPPLPNWMVTASVSVAGGYRDNILLSPTNPVGSTLLRGEFETMFLRVPVNAWDGYVFVNGAETRFLSADQTDHERTVFVVSELRWQPNESWKATLLGQGYHHDQVFDVSATEVDFATAALKVTGFVLAPSLRWKFLPQTWVEVKALGRQDSYDRDVDGYREGEGSVKIGQEWGDGSEVVLGAARRWRAHDSREQYTVGGRPIFGSLLKVQQTEATLRVTWAVDAAKRWKFGATLLHEENRDNGTGYFDYNRQQLTADMTWRAEPWELRFAAAAAEYEFPVQEIGIGITPEIRRKSDRRVTVELTRKINETWTAFGLVEVERARSNDERSRFRSATGYAGIRWSWDGLAKTIEEL